MKVIDTEFEIDKTFANGKLQCSVLCRIWFDPYSVLAQQWRDARQDAAIYLVEKAISNQKTLIPCTAIGKAVYKQGDEMDEKQAMKIAESKAKRNMYKKAANIAISVVDACEDIIDSAFHKDYNALSLLEDIHIKEMQGIPLDSWETVMKPLLIDSLRNKSQE